MVLYVLLLIVRSVILLGLLFTLVFTLLAFIVDKGGRDDFNEVAVDCAEVHLKNVSYPFSAQVALASA